MSAPLAPGRLLGEWTLEAPLGRGGMAEVWRARSASRGLMAALKVLSEERAEVPAQAERFLREARTSASLRHPGVVEIYAAGRDEGRLWLAMELLDGEDLSARLRRGPLAADEAVRVVRAVGTSLAFAHAHGVLHRDVKGANIFLTSGGAVKLLDLGIARAAGDETMTATGELLGTLTHLAPELARGARASVASELYALGVTLFECLAGRLPFQGNAVSLVMHHTRTAPPRVRSLAPAVPAALDELVDQLLAKDPAARPASAAALIAAIDAIPVVPSRELSAEARPLAAALAELEKTLATHQGAVAVAEATWREAQAEARAALLALQRAADAWLTAPDGQGTLPAAEQRWVSARDRVASAWHAHQAARAARDDAQFQSRALRERLAEVAGG